VKVTDREEGYEIDNTTGRSNIVPLVVLVLLALALVIWRIFL